MGLALYIADYVNPSTKAVHFALFNSFTTSCIPENSARNHV